jgi:NifB/MoaA-like Fe-S oxidoreductase
LEQIGNIELNISINSSSLKGREKLYRGKSHIEAVEAVKSISDYNISFSGSIVAMPHLVGWEDIKDTVMFLSNNEASVIRIFMPGYTKFSKVILPPEDIREKLMEFTEKIGKSISTPLFLEPSGVKDLNAIVEGVLKDSPAWKSGIVKGDRILRVNGADVKSRVDAFYKILKADNPKLEIHHSGELKKLTVSKKAKDSSGMVFNYDIHPDGIADIERGILRNGAKGCIILTSELDYGILVHCIEQNEKVRIETVKNKFFGGNIMCAGLLTLQDIEAHLTGRIQQSEVVLLPEIMFDASGRDLLGRHFKEIEESLGIKVEVI